LGDLILLNNYGELYRVISVEIIGNKVGICLIVLKNYLLLKICIEEDYLCGYMEIQHFLVSLRGK
jgi:hypothetical protein